MVSGGDALVTSDVLREKGEVGAGPVNFVMFAAAHNQFFRRFLVPFQRSFGAEDPEAVVVAVADSDLCGGDDGGAAVLEFGDHVEIVVEQATGNERVEPCRNFGHLQTADPGGCDEGVRADIASAVGDTGVLRIDAPYGLLMAGRFEVGGQPALVIPRLHFADIADSAGLDELACVHHLRVGRCRYGPIQTARCVL